MPSGVNRSSKRTHSVISTTRPADHGNRTRRCSIVTPTMSEPSGWKTSPLGNPVIASRRLTFPSLARANRLPVLRIGENDFALGREDEVVRTRGLASGQVGGDGFEDAVRAESVQAACDHRLGEMQPLQRLGRDPAVVADIEPAIGAEP